MQKCLVITQLTWRNEALHHTFPMAHPQLLVTHFPIDLTPDSFGTGPSDYDVASDEIYCPCGKVIPWPSGVIGDALRLIQAELKEHGK